MKDRLRSRQLIGLTTLITLGLIFLTWANYKFSEQNPGGNDFLVHWVGTRALFIDGISPYSDEVAARIQNIVYGRLALPGEHELRVAYPLYSVALFFPFALISHYELARALWMTINELLLIILAINSVRLCNWKPSFWGLTGFILFTLFWYHGIRPLINGNAIIFVAFLIVAALMAIKNRADEFAGVLLGLATIKPQVIILLLIFIFIWSGYQKRYRIMSWFLITIIFLSISSALIIPDWPIQNLREIINFSNYNPPGTPSAVLTSLLPAFGGRIGVGISVVTVSIILFEWWIARHQKFEHFLWTCLLTLSAGQWIGILTEPGNYIILLPVFPLVFSVLSKKFNNIGAIMIFITLLVFLLTWGVFIFTLERIYQPVQNPLMIFILPGISIILLYWVRWWVVKPSVMHHEEL